MGILTQHFQVQTQMDVFFPCQNCVVVGLGESGADIVREISEVGWWSQHTGWTNEYMYCICIVYVLYIYIQYGLYPIGLYMEYIYIYMDYIWIIYGLYMDYIWIISINVLVISTILWYRLVVSKTIEHTASSGSKCRAPPIPFLSVKKYALENRKIETKSWRESSIFNPVSL